MNGIRDNLHVNLVLEGNYEVNLESHSTKSARDLAAVWFWVRLNLLALFIGPFKCFLESRKGIANFT